MKNKNQKLTLRILNDNQKLRNKNEKKSKIKSEKLETNMKIEKREKERIILRNLTMVPLQIVTLVSL